LDSEGYYVIPPEQAMASMIELQETQDIASHLLKHYVEEFEPKDWENTAVPEVAELYSGSRACIFLLQDMMEQEPPPEYREKTTSGGMFISGEQFIGFVGLLETLRRLKAGITVRHNISFEVH
jgi:hypothetical protein